MRSPLATMTMTAALLCTGAASAQEPPLEGEVTEVESIEVRGQPLVDAVRAFVQDASGAPRGNTIARWDHRDGVCVGVVNLRADYRLEKDLSLFARVGNLFDKDYELKRDYETPGRTVFVGIRYQPK